MFTFLPSLHDCTQLPRRCLSTIILKRRHSVTCSCFPGVIWWRRTQCCARRPWGRERSRGREENTTTPCWESDCLMGACCKVRTFLKNSFQSRKTSEDGRGKWLVIGVIPGTFYAWDRLPVLFGFVRESLVDGWQPFELIAPGGQKLQESEDVALVECNLVGWCCSHFIHLCTDKGVFWDHIS